jgi:hypothetical protein
MSLDSQIKETMQTVQSNAQERWNELAQESQQWVAEQVNLLNKQAQQLQAQSRQLRKALRRRARKRRKLTAQLNKSSRGLGKELLKRGSEITQYLLDIGGKTTHELTERSGELTHELKKQSGKVSEVLGKRGQRLLEPVRKRDRTFWTFIGFGVGLIAASAITYQLVRRLSQQVMEQEEHIELPQDEIWNGSRDKPAGEIRYLDQEGSSVATLEVIDMETVEQTADATIVGVISTKQYYPAGTDIESKDLIYFATEEEARSQGFRAAE